MKAGKEKKSKNAHVIGSPKTKQCINAYRKNSKEKKES